jgi:hypothetical protein
MMLSIGGGILVLLNSSVSNMVPYMLSFFLLPKGVLNRLDFFGQKSFCRVIAKRNNLVWIREMLSVIQKTKVG